MATTLVQREGLGGSNWQACALDDPTSMRRGRLDEIVAAGERVVLLMPGDDAVARKVHLPNVRAAERREAALSILEPYLAASAEDLALACYPLGGSEALAVWVDKARLASWTAAIRGAGAEVIAVVPEWLLLFRQRVPGTTVLWSQDERSWLLSSRDEALCVENGLLPDVLGPIVEAEASSTLIAHGSVPDNALDNLSAQGVTVGRSGAMDWLSIWRDAGAPENLDFRRLIALRQDGNEPLKWRAAVATAVFAVLAVSAYVVNELNTLEAERDFWDASSIATFRAAFPAESRVSDVKRQLRQKLREANITASGGSASLALVGGLAYAVDGQQDVQISALRFEAGQLIASLDAAAIAQLESLRARAEDGVPELSPRLERLVATDGKAQADLHLTAARP